MQKPPPLASRSAVPAAAAHLERALDSAVECLDRLEPSDRTRDLRDRATRLKEQMQGWHSAPPSTEAREAVMRGALSIQLAAVAMLGGKSRVSLP